ncbi:MAG: hypothetical protein K1060chlam5_01034 [Candidatus Anoxychlamydiales bacterium]|nr:hypothetical protein [Candidatus Anoxychlamydiales bacterium]
MFNLPLFEGFFASISAIIAGLIFGFLLRKALVSRFNTIVNQLLLKDFTVVKVIFSAIVVGSIGIYFLNSFNLVKINVSSQNLLPAILGGGIFGIGMAITGYCPGTAMAALGDGAKDMYYGVPGMVLGAMIYAEFYPKLSKLINLNSKTPNPTFANLFNASPWIFIVILVVFALILFYLIDTKFRKKR